MLSTLPIELIDYILSFVSEPSNRRRAALVCKQFHRIIRYQSAKSGDIFKIGRFVELDSPAIRLFQEVELFPFSKLELWYSSGTFTAAHPFWETHGGQITDITLDIHVKNLDGLLDSLLPELGHYFPALQRLRIISYYKGLSLTTNLTLLPNLEELDLRQNYLSTQTVAFLLGCCPNVCRLHLSSDLTDYTTPEAAEFLHSIANLEQLDFWIFSNEYCEYFEAQNLKPLLQLPAERLHLHECTIYSKSDKLEVLREFFRSRRRIDCLFFLDSDLLTREKLEAIRSTSVVREILLHNGGVPSFGGALELLGTFNGLERLEFEATEVLSAVLADAPSDTVVAKVHRIDFEKKLDTRTLLGVVCVFKQLWALNFHEQANVITDEELQAIVKNCKRLRKLVIRRSVITDAGLMGGKLTEWRPISTLKCLEKLVLCCRRVTDRAFASAIRFAHLRKLRIYGMQISSTGIRSLIKNCPTLEILSFEDCPKVDDECLELISMRLLHLRELAFNETKVSMPRAVEIKRRSPHIQITLDYEIVKY